jgi:DNA-binding protein Fis
MVEPAKVLLVDQDQGEAYEALSRGLSRHGYELHPTSGVGRALALADAHQYKAALLALPLMYDPTLVAGLHTEHPGLPIVVILPPHGLNGSVPPTFDTIMYMVRRPLLLDPLRLLLDRIIEILLLRAQLQQQRQAWCPPWKFPTSPEASSGAPDAPLTFEDVLHHRIRYIIPHLEIVGKGTLHRAVISHIEKLLLTIVLEECRGNQVRAAEVLGINRNTLRRKIREFDLSIRGKA